MTQTLSSSEVRDKLVLFEFKSGRKASVVVLKRLLPDIETALFFAKALEMDYKELTRLINVLFNTDVVRALLSHGGHHSTELQDYIVDVVPANVLPSGKSVNFKEDFHHAGFLPAFWDELEVTIAGSLKEVANKLSLVLDALPGKEGAMTFTTMRKINKQRPTIGQFQPVIKHPPVPDNLLILDVSGSVSEATVAAIAADVVALGWKSNSHLAIVSDDCFFWKPGEYSVADVLAAAQYSGTHYEKLAPLFDRDWNTVISIADYDSSSSAGLWVKTHSKGQIGNLLDLSLVDKPTYLAEVLGVLAHDVKPLLVASVTAGLVKPSYW